MASVGLTEAARLVRRNQSTVHRAMQTGRLSFTIDAAGKRVVDTAELDRVFGIKTVAAHDSFDESLGSVTDPRGNGAGHAHAAKSKAAHERVTVLLHGEHAALHQLLADRDACIADLRGRLDASEAERRQLGERLHGLLTDRREKAPETGRFSPADPKRLRDVAVSDPPAEPGQSSLNKHSELGDRTGPSASSDLAIPRPPWWRRWFR
jgi:hypothetical protein